jgi:hypothetical protein
MTDSDNNRSPDREQLLDDLRAFAAELGKTPTRTEMNDRGPHSSTPYYTAFGSWNDALRAAGFGTNHENDVSDERLIEELRRLAKDLERVPRFEDMADHGAFSPHTYMRRWGSWPEAKDAAGLDARTTTSRRISEGELLEALRDLAVERGRPPTIADMNEHGPYSHRPYYRTFDSWNAALGAAGFDPNHTNGYDESLLIEELRALADEMGHTPAMREMRQHGRYSPDAYITTFGSWTEAWRAAGLDARDWYPARATERDLLEAIQTVAEGLGHVPSREEIIEHGPYSRSPYERAFGSWSAALEAAGFEPYREGDVDGEYVYYGASWPRQRERALRRDQYRCQDPKCSLTDADHRARFGRGVEVHHRTKFRRFDSHEKANGLWNLVTLCRAHHDEWEKRERLG